MAYYRIQKQKQKKYDDHQSFSILLLSLLLHYHISKLKAGIRLEPGNPENSDFPGFFSRFWAIFSAIFPVAFFENFVIRVIRVRARY
mgnify:CR=1 FL=1